MQKCKVPWDWYEDVLPGDAWRHPDSNCDLPLLLDLLFSGPSGSGADEVHTELVDQLVPSEALREIHVIQVDAHDALRRPAGFGLTANLFAWVVGCVWQDPAGLELLREGRTLVHVQAEGREALAYLCIPLRSDYDVQSIIACSVTASSRDRALRMAACLTVLSSVVPSAEGSRLEDVHRAASMTGMTESLTPRQVEVLRWMSKGMTNRQIAARICFSESTVRLESMAIYRHFGVHSRSQAVAAARESGLLSEEMLPLEP